LAIAAFFLAPALFGFSQAAAGAARAVAWAYLGLVLLTAYPLGLIKWIPFTVHGGIELITSVALLALPWLAGFSEDSAGRNFFVSSGFALFAVWLMTDYKALGVGPRAGVSRRSGVEDRPLTRV
jgi:hypothetical protein